MEDAADRQQAIHSIKKSAEEVISKFKDSDGLPEEERLKIDGQYSDYYYHIQ